MNFCLIWAGRYVNRAGRTGVRTGRKTVRAGRSTLGWNTVISCSVEMSEYSRQATGRYWRTLWRTAAPCRARRTWRTPPAYGGHYKHRQRITPVYGYTPQPGERGAPHQRTGVTTSTDSALPLCTAIRHSQVNVAHPTSVRGSLQAQTGHYPRVRLYATARRTWHMPPAYGGHYKHRQRITPVYGYTPQSGERSACHQRTGVTTSTDRALPPCTAIRHSQANVAHATSVRGSLQAQTGHYPRVRLYATVRWTWHTPPAYGGHYKHRQVTTSHSQANVAHPTSVRGSLQAQTAHYPRVRLYATSRWTWHTPPAYGGHYKHRQRITPVYDYTPQPGECNKTAFGSVIFNRGRSLVIALSLSITLWLLIRYLSDYPLMVPRVFCDVNGGNRIQNGFPWPRCWICGRILYVKMNVICHQWRHRRLGRLLGRSAMTATFQRDVQLTACYKNKLTGTGRCNYIHSTQYTCSISNGQRVFWL